ncbi:MAG: hypothetical protein IKN63_04295 [Bacilli bacterium]|nr:hypothetical protein [Bacilli bacterium]
MKFSEYNIFNPDGKSNCVIRTFCKIFNKSYEDIYNDLCQIKEELNSSLFNDIEVFETYMKRNNIFKINNIKDIKIKDLKLENGIYVIFCYDKKSFYHMVPIINNILYDKDSKSLDLYIITLYKLKR